ncbi:leucine-rich repeat-containing protein 40-like [Anopheles nili]|uniref:leucine-rich repeat-containing protein 40-like n=1 Tax=Anopheles nili TaxID=185578 RepID=UPI00237BD8DF|nr:leucine-rich repeat-containing protein 40-like [Anopheles nili]
MRASLISVIICSSPAIAKVIACTRVQRNSSCIIDGVSLVDPLDEYSTVFPTSTHIIIESSEILHFSVHLFEALDETAFLTLKGSFIPAVTFRSDGLHSLRIDNTELREFAVGPQENRNLNTLIINGNPLSTIPPTIRHLVGLSILDLSNNQLEHVNLNWFQVMDNLLVLDLSGNRIVRLDVHPALRLGRLKNLWVSHNQLRQIDFFPSVLPSLQRVRLVDNQWSCEWVARVRESIWNLDIQVYGAEHACSEKLDGGICCYEDNAPYATVPSAVEEVVFLGRTSRLGESQPRAERLFAPDDKHEEHQLKLLKQSYNVLEQKYRRLVEEKDQLERRFVNTVRELERTIKRLTDELTDAQDAARLRRPKEG